MKNGQLTIAALLLFGKNPQRFLLQVRVRCARFKGDNEVEFLDLKIIEGDLVQQVEEAMSFVRRNISMTAKIEGERWSAGNTGSIRWTPSAKVSRTPSVTGITPTAAMYW
jgi:predicted HTH transcriptional regulator